MSLFSRPDDTRLRIWRQLCREIGAELVEGGVTRPEAVQLRIDDWIVTLDAPVLQNGMMTRVRAPFVDVGGVSFVVYRTGLGSGVYHLFGRQDIEVGDGLFDVYFRVTGSPEEEVRELFGDPEMKGLLRQLPNVRFELTREGRWSQPRLPDGVSQLHCQIPGVVRSPDHLRTLFDLFVHTLQRLGGDPPPPGREGDVDRLVERLGWPSGTMEDPGGLVLWDGNGPRRRAADGLGSLGDPRAVPALLGALDADDEELRRIAIVALGRLGDEKAIGPLIPFLAEPTRLGRPFLRRAARESLEGLGATNVVEAFENALSGDLDGITDAFSGYRTEAARALIRALDDFSATASAARALAVLGATEALPELRRRSRGFGVHTEITDACREATVALEARLALPMRAAAPSAESTESLPRPAGNPEPGRETLPRSRGPEADDAPDG